jgi:CcmD family protein
MRKVRFIPLIMFLLCCQLVFAQSATTIASNGKADTISKANKASEEKLKDMQQEYNALQQEKAVEMADGMRSNGKIYVVVGVLVIILFGLIAYLISIDRKVSRVEKELGDKKKK